MTDGTTDVRLEEKDLEKKKIIVFCFDRIYYHHQKNVHLNENIVENNNDMLRKRKINDQIRLRLKHMIGLLDLFDLQKKENHFYF